MKEKIRFPKLKFEVYFSGKVTAYGQMILYYPKKRIKNIKAKFNGKFHKDKLILNEEFIESNTKTDRVWTFKKISDLDFIGHENNVLSPFNVRVENNMLNMNYRFKTNYKNYNFSVNIKDNMYLINNKLLLNKSKVSKFGITIAETILLYTKL